MMAYAFSNSVDKGQYEEREAAYLATVGKYSKEEACLLGDCLPGRLIIRCKIG